jgi:hypothetical protein
MTWLGISTSYSQCPDNALEGTPGGSTNFKCLQIWWNNPANVPSNLSSIVIQSNGTSYTYGSGAGTNANRAIFRNKNCNGVNGYEPLTLIITINEVQCDFSGGVLPVKYGVLAVTKINNNKIRVFWQALSEKNSHNFVVERSNQSLEFQELKSILSIGGENLQANYEYIDDNPSNEILYYRIAQYDFNGEKEYSKILKIDNRINTTDPIYYFDAVAKSLKIELLDKKPLWFSIHNLNGQEILNFQVTNDRYIDLSPLSSGLYILSFRGNSISSSKIIIP